MVRNVVLSGLRFPISESSSGMQVTSVNELNENFFQPSSYKQTSAIHNRVITALRQAKVEQ